MKHTTNDEKDTFIDLFIDHKERFFPADTSWEYYRRKRWDYKRGTGNQYIKWPKNI